MGNVSRTKAPARSRLLAQAVSRAKEAMRECVLCPRQCRVNRLAGQAGYCRAPYPAQVFYRNLLYGEEAEICPSFEIFFTGCNLRCSFCYVSRWVEDPHGARPYGPGALEAWKDELKGSCKSISFIGGEPTVNTLGILESLIGVESCPTLVWNSNMYMGGIVPEILDGIVDLYIGDLHFFNDRCSESLAATSRYFHHAAAALERIGATTRVILRHLLIPGHWECCFVPMARWIREHLAYLPVHLMGNYVDRAGTRIGSEELARARQFALDIGLSLHANSFAGRVPAEVPSGDANRTYPEEVIIQEDGSVIIKHLTLDMLNLACSLNPEDEPLQRRKRAFDSGGDRE